MLHVGIRADVSEVHFENIWIFKRQSADSPWQASIDLPEGAVLVGIDEPNQTEFLPASKTIRKDMPADSLIDSIGFTFALPNRNGACQTFIATAYRIDSMLVSVSGQTTKFASNVLKHDDYRTSRSRFAAVYTAGNLHPGRNVEMVLTSLPQPDTLLAQYLCIAGLALIIIIALFTISSARAAKKT